MILDFTNLSAKDTKRLNEIAGKIKADYTEFVDECCRKYDSYLFWTTPFASRNTYNDDTYLQVSRLLLAKEIAAENPDIDGIATETRGEYLALRNLKDLTVPISYRKTGFFGFLRKKLDRWRGLASYIRRHLAYILYADDFEFKYPEEVSIVIGPAISTDFNGYYFNDRYTTGIFEYHDGLYLPYFVNTRHLPNKVIFDRIRNCSNYRFLYDRSLTRISDVCEIIGYWLYVNKIKKDAFKYKGIDVSAIVSQNLEMGKGNSTSYDGLIMRKMLARLAQKGVRVQNFIQWYEGRPFDVLTASAIRKYFPEANSVGYEGYPLTGIVLGEYISSFQYESGFSPDKMAIPGKIYEKSAHQFCNDISLMFVPVLRNEYKYRSSRISSNRRKTILALLSYTWEASVEIIRGILDYISVNENEYQIALKNHPTNDGFTINDYGFDTDCCVQYVKGNLTDCLNDVDIVVTSMTSSTMEVAYAGIPLIVLYLRGQLGYTCFPEEIEGQLCKIAYSSKEIERYLGVVLNKDMFDNSVLENYLLKKNQESIIALFD